MKAAPDSPEAQNALGSFFCRNKQQAKGQEMFLKAATNPLYRTPFVAYTNAGVCARSSGNLDEAERFLRQALTSQVDLPRDLRAARRRAARQGNNLQARAFVERFLADRAGDARHAAARATTSRVALKDDGAAAVFSERLQKEFPEFGTDARARRHRADRNPG